MTNGRIAIRFEGRNIRRENIPLVRGMILQGFLCVRTFALACLLQIAHKILYAAKSHRAVRLCCAATISSQLALLAPAYAENYALVIGISNYDYVATREGIIPLEFPDDDARDLKVSLEAKGYTVFSLVDEKTERQDIMNAFVQLREIIKEEDSFILFFCRAWDA